MCHGRQRPALHDVRLRQPSLLQLLIKDQIQIHQDFDVLGGIEDLLLTQFATPIAGLLCLIQLNAELPLSHRSQAVLQQRNAVVHQPRSQHQVPGSSVEVVAVLLQPTKVKRTIERTPEARHGEEALDLG